MNIALCDGSEADTEWSDEGHHTEKTDTLTGSDQEERSSSSSNPKVKFRGTRLHRRGSGDLRINMKPKVHRRSHTVGHTPTYRHDAADIIMDNIDTALYRMTKLSPGQPHSKLTREQRRQLAAQGVEFDTGDETSKGKCTVKESLAKLRANKSFEKTADEGDTGVGSVDDPGSDLDVTMTSHIVGKADVYSGHCTESSEEEEDHKREYAEIDSDSAKQINEKYKMIMKNKKDAACSKPVDSATDQESLKTEDIEAEFQKTLTYSNPVSMVTNAAKPGKDAKPNKKTSSKPSKSKPSRPPVTMTTQSKHKKSRSHPRSGHQTSDIESIKTEDFENQFQTMVVKQVANVPITNFDRFMVDSDLDTIRSQVIRDKFHSALHKSYNGESDVSSDTESRIDILVEQKINEILQKVKANGELSDLESLRAYQGSPQARRVHEESEEERCVTPIYSRSRPRSSKVKKQPKRSPVIQRKARESYNDEVGEEAQEIERQTAQIRRELESEGWHSGRHTPSSSPQRSITPTPCRSHSPHNHSPSAQIAYAGVSYSPRLSPSYTSLPARVELVEPNSLKMRDELSKLQLEVIRAKQEQQAVNISLEQAKEALTQHQKEIKSTEKQVKEHRAKAENARSELMLAEFKRDSARKEAEMVKAEVKKKRLELDIFAETDQTTTDGNTSTDQSKLRDLKLSRTEAAKMMAEREEFRKKSETLERQYKELERQLGAAKEGLINDQKTARQREDSLRDELEACEAKLQEANTDCDNLQSKVQQLEGKLDQIEQHQAKVIEEKCAEYEELKTQIQQQMAQMKLDASNELADVRRQLSEMTEKYGVVTGELKAKDQATNKLQEQLINVQTKLTEQLDLATTLREENKNCAKKMQEEKGNAITQLKLRAEEDKNHSLDELSAELEHQHNILMGQVEQRYQEDLANLEAQVKARESELGVLKDRLQQQDSMTKQLAEKIKNEANTRFRQLLQEEKEKWNEEKAREISRNVSVVMEEADKTTKKLREELGAERQLVDSQLRQIMDLKKELETTRIHTRQSVSERLSLYKRHSGAAKDHEDHQVKVMRQMIEEDNHKSIERLRETINKQTEELDRLQKENKELSSRESEVNNSLDSHDRALLSDINDECRKVAAAVGISPRVVTFTSCNGMIHGKTNLKPNMKAAIETALNNLRNSNEDLRKHLADVKQELDNQRQTMKAEDKEKKAALDALKQKMQKEKLKALETLKDRLIKEHLEEVDKLHKSLGKGKSMHKALRQKDSELQEIQNNMKKWKEQCTEKLATQFQEEMTGQLEKRLREYKRQQKEWERERASQQREIEHLETQLHARSHTTGSSGNPNRTTQIYGTPMKAPPPSADSETAKQVKQLEFKVKQLEVENSSLKHSKKLSTSSPDLNRSFCDISYCDTPRKEEHVIRQLEIQLQRTENRLKLTEDRAEKNDTLLNQKLMELSKLQGALTQQTKELMQLERAYTQLQQKISVRPISR